jgi:hypothetical protein
MLMVVFADEAVQVCDTIATWVEALLPHVSCVVSQGAVGGAATVVVTTGLVVVGVDAA